MLYKFTSLVLKFIVYKMGLPHMMVTVKLMRQICQQIHSRYLINAIPFSLHKGLTIQGCGAYKRPNLVSLSPVFLGPGSLTQFILVSHVCWNYPLNCCDL